jgi:hypothetical protein
MKHASRTIGVAIASLTFAFAAPTLALAQSTMGTSGGGAADQYQYGGQDQGQHQYGGEGQGQHQYGGQDQGEHNPDHGAQTPPPSQGANPAGSTQEHNRGGGQQTAPSDQNVEHGHGANPGHTEQHGGSSTESGGSNM